MFKLISSFFSKFIEKKNIILKLIISYFPKLIEKKNIITSVIFTYFSNLNKKIPIFKSFLNRIKNSSFKLILFYFGKFSKLQKLIFIGIIFLVFLLIIFAIKKPSTPEIEKEDQSTFSKSQTETSPIVENEKEKDISEDKPKKAITKKLSDDVKKKQPPKKQKEQKKPKVKKTELSEKKQPLKPLSAKFTINSLHKGLRNISTNPNDVNQIFILVKENYDTEKMLEKIIGNTWKKLGKVKKNEIKKVFEEYIAKNYVKRFKKIGDPVFEYKETKQLGNNISMVATNLLVDDEKFSMNYLLAKSDQRWKIFDVLLAGSISEVATKKSEFRNFIKNEDVDPLIEALKKKNNQLLN